MTLLAPGLWLQRLTTREPTLDQLEVSIRALKEVLQLEGRTPTEQRVEVMACPKKSGALARAMTTFFGGARAQRLRALRAGADTPSRYAGRRLSAYLVMAIESSSTSWSAPTARRRSACPTLPSTTTTARRREVGRRLKELEGPYKLARGVARACGPTSRRRAGRRRPPRARAGARGAARAARGGAEARARRGGPGRQQGRPRRDPAGSGRRRGGALGRRPLPDADALRGAARLQDRGALRRARARAAASRTSRSRVKGDGAYSVFKWEGGTHRVQRVPADRVAGPHPHVHRDRGRDARGRGGRGRDRPERAEDRRLPLDRPGRPEREHDRLRGPDHAPADGPRRRDAGREVAAPEQGEGDARPARPAVSSSSASEQRAEQVGAAALADRRAASARRRSAPTTSPRAGSPTTASS